MSPGTKSSHVLVDHDDIRRWAEQRDATPSCVKGTGGKGDTGMIRLDFPGYTGRESLQPIEWDAWFEAFDENNLALIVQDKIGGQQSNFNKLVAREKSPSAKSRSSGSGKSRSSSAGKGGAKKASAKSARSHGRSAR